MPVPRIMSATSLLAIHNRGFRKYHLTQNSLAKRNLSGHTGQWLAQFDMYMDRCAPGVNLRGRRSTLVQKTRTFTKIGAGKKNHIAEDN